MAILTQPSFERAKPLSWPTHPVKARRAMDRQLALVLFSGGQDSTTCLAWTLDRFASVETVGFEYGQRHRAEMEVRPRILSTLHKDFPHWRDRLGEDHVLSLDFFRQIGGTALTGSM